MGSTVTSAFQVGTHFPLFWEYPSPPVWLLRRAKDKDSFLLTGVLSGSLVAWFMHSPHFFSKISLVLLLSLGPGLDLLHSVLIWSQTSRPLPKLVQSWSRKALPWPSRYMGKGVAQLTLKHFQSRSQCINSEPQALRTTFLTPAWGLPGCTSFLLLDGQEVQGCESKYNQALNQSWVVAGTRMATGWAHIAPELIWALWLSGSG